MILSLILRKKIKLLKLDVLFPQMSQKSDFLKHLRTNIIFVSFSEFVPKMHGPKMHFIRYWFQWSANPSARPLIQKMNFLNERKGFAERKGKGDKQFFSQNKCFGKSSEDFLKTIFCKSFICISHFMNFISFSYSKS